MCGIGSTSAFGQSSSSPSGSQSVFGQTNNANNNPFALEPFGGTTPIGSQTGGSGGTCTCMFGGPQISLPFSSMTTIGSSPAFASPAPTFGATSASAIGGSSTSFGGSSIVDQKSAFGIFGSNTQTSPFGSTRQPSQPGFGSGLFDSTTTFGPSNQSTFGAASSPGFGASSTPPFGSSSTPAFGASGTLGFAGFAESGTPSFVATSTPTFAASGTGARFVASNNPAFGTGGGGFGASCAPVFPSSSTPGFSASTTSRFGGTSSTLASGASSATAFGAQFTTPFGDRVFCQPCFARNRRGSKVAAYSATAESSDALSGVKLESISAMPTYKDKSHEELRWEDYQLGDKGRALPPSQSSISLPSSAPSNLFCPPSSNLFQPTSTLGQTSFPVFTQNTAPSIFPSGRAASFVPPTTSLFTSTAGKSTSLFAPSSTTPSFNQSNMCNTPSIGFQFPTTQPMMPPSNNQGLFNQTALPQSSPFPLSQPSQPARGFCFCNFGQSQAAPFGTLPAMPQIQISIGRAGTTPTSSVQYGISDLPVIICQFNLLQM